jgi:hypothetical protein
VLTPAIILACAPLVEFSADLAVGKLFGFVPEVVTSLIREDSRQPVKAAVANDAVSGAIHTYFEFGSEVEATFHATILTLLSVALSQYECTGSILQLTIPHAVLGAVLTIFGFFFAVQLWRKKIEAAVPGACTTYHRFSLFLSFLVILLSIVGKQYPALCRTGVP